MFFSPLLLVGASLVSLVAGHGVVRGPIDKRQTGNAIPPSQDPWYKAPSNLTAYKPGAVIKFREAPGGLAGKTANCSRAVQILYRTTDSRGNPEFAVTTVFSPNSGIRAKNALLSYHEPYDSADVDESPSFAYQSGTPDDVTLSLGRGWFVSVPDYEGPKASFTAGRMSGYAVLDSVRAVLARRNDFGLVSNTKYAMLGYSGGSIAATWAAELQPNYAKELSFSGAACGGTVPNVTSSLLLINGTIASGLIPPGILGFTSQYPRLEKKMISLLKTTGEFNKTGFLAARNYGLYESLGKFVFRNIGDYFNGGLDALFAPDFVRDKLNRDGVLQVINAPKMPMFWYKAIADIISIVGETDAIVKRYCNAGTKILYERNTVGDHLSEQNNGLPRALNWLQLVFDGKLSQPQCVTRNVTVG